MTFTQVASYPATDWVNEDFDNEMERAELFSRRFIPAGYRRFRVGNFRRGRWQS